MKAKKRQSVLDEIASYSSDAVDGKIIACKKHKWACLRFLRDLERKWEWVFDEERAARYFEWMALFKHRKGPLAGQQKIPTLYEKFVYGNIYGWVHEDTGHRRFRRSYEQLARKNAKSQDKAIQALYEISAFGEPSAEAYVAATKKEQTRHVWGEADWLYKNSELLKDKFITKFDQELMQVIIRHKKSDSFFSRLSKEDRRTGDGANPQFMVLDEYHLHETTEYYDLGTSGMRTRIQPLLSIITTAGFELNNPCHRVEYKYVSEILDPNNPVKNERYFGIICELDKNEEGNLLDDIKDEACWVKPNPIIGDTDVGRESIRTDLEEALDKPEKMRDLLTKTFNIWVNQRAAGYMDTEKWAACASDSFPDVSGMRVYPGIDLSSTLDLTSVGFVIPLGDDSYAVMQHSFMPEETLWQKCKIDKVPYDLWCKEGWMTATPGAEVDYHFVLEYIKETFAEYEWPIGECCFDRALATWLMHEVQELGFTPVDIPQSYSGLSPATKDFRAKVYNKKIIHQNDPVLNWAVGNAIVRKGPSENIMLDKSKAAQRFDPLAALITAHVRAMVGGDDNKKSVYEERGLVVL